MGPVNGTAGEMGPAARLAPGKRGPPTMLRADRKPPTERPGRSSRKAAAQRP